MGGPPPGLQWGQPVRMMGSRRMNEQFEFEPRLRIPDEGLRQLRQPESEGATGAPSNSPPAPAPVPVPVGAPSNGAAAAASPAAATAGGVAAPPPPPPPPAPP